MKADTNHPKIWPQLILVVIGAVTGCAFQFSWWSSTGRLGALQDPSALVKLTGAVLVAVAGLFGLRMVMRWAVQRLPVSSHIKSKYSNYDTFTYSVFLFLFAGAVGIRLSIPFFYILGIAFVAAQGLLAFLVIKNTEEGESVFRSLGWLSFLFLVSGFAALIYQVVWQRMLFAAYGVNIESVTVIVSIFMFGLGTGSLVGGVLSKIFPGRLPQLFVLCEFAIGTIGVISLPLMKWFTDIAVHESLISVSLTTYALLFWPTLFMGATLPILVSYLHRHNKHIGKSVGALYFFNTIGSAIAALVTVDVLFVFLGQQSTVIVAAAFNFIVGILVLAYCRRSFREEAEMASELASDFGERKNIPSISYAVALLLAGASGYVSLSQEIIWVRAAAYASGGMPHVFGHTLGFFLLGVAGGGLVGRKVSDQSQICPLTFVAGMFLASALLCYVSIPLSSFVISVSKVAGMLVFYLTVTVAALLLGSVFPILCHFSIRSSTSVGLSIAGIYVANILGSTAGPLFTGFVLMNLWTMEQIIMYLSMLSLTMAAGVVLLGKQSSRARAGVLGGVIVVLTVFVGFQERMYRGVLERLHFAKDELQQKDFKYVVQNRSGILAVSTEEGGDIVFGGGVYDGRFNIDPVVNSNGIRRAYMLAALHPNPKEILEIGLSSGSWTWVMAAHEGVKKITVVEINPGYLELIAQYPDHRTLLSNPKISYEFDDGRRWLRRHPEARFDFILMNTTFHWRSNITHLLSREFLEICRSRLKQGGVIYYNTTGSVDVIFTAASVFKYVTTYENFVAASDRPFSMTMEERTQNLLRFEVDGRTILDGGNPMTQTILKEMAANDLPDLAGKMRRRPDLQVITEDNMLTEFKKMNSRMSHWYKWYDPQTSWKNLHPIGAILRKFASR